eukprot:CAMPEP_0168195420 /NCGR_PEP_ID=MMETSP0139_2-20121125/19834_1 /TAXON_ID=44445 /ORGANISM="Pseudo-nitzschia australis, Strain 10249 10 AB" /LENGTH=122 /DNA_ID=CAMNT_0008119249 /DNA_START=468 /DNA_END=836 /DNA_ORIENTATION=+
MVGAFAVPWTLDNDTDTHIDKYIPRTTRLYTNTRTITITQRSILLVSKKCTEPERCKQDDDNDDNIRAFNIHCMVKGAAIHFITHADSPIQVDTVRSNPIQANSITIQSVDTNYSNMYEVVY